MVHIRLMCLSVFSMAVSPLLRPADTLIGCDRFSPDAAHFCPPGLLTVAAKTNSPQRKPRLRRPSPIIAKRNIHRRVSRQDFLLHVQATGGNYDLKLSRKEGLRLVSRRFKEADYDELMDRFL